MVAEIDKRGNREETFYDFAGRADRAVRKDGSELDFDPVQVQGLYASNRTIDPLNAPVAFQLGAVESTYVDGNGNTIVNTLDQAGQIVSSTDEVGALPTVERNEDNLITSQTDGRGNVTNFTYDERGNVLSLQDSLSFGGQFIDISGTGDVVPGIQNTDDNSTLVNLPFEFTFFDQNYNQIGVSSNGLLSLGGTNFKPTPTPLLNLVGLVYLAYLQYCLSGMTWKPLAMKVQLPAFSLKLWVNQATNNL
ncbi:MAG: RHS repeat protein [Richelia sp. RM1_1_1]|nr:RHS repeat protein [Richelia sp. RM1_1_1]